MKRILYSNNNTNAEIDPNEKPELHGFVMEIDFEPANQYSKEVQQKYQQDMEEFQEQADEWNTITEEMIEESDGEPFDNMQLEPPKAELYLTCSTGVVNGPSLIDGAVIKYPFPVTVYSIVNNTNKNLRILQDDQTGILQMQDQILQDFARQLQDIGVTSAYEVNMFMRYKGNIIGNDIVKQKALNAPGDQENTEQTNFDMAGKPEQTQNAMKQQNEPVSTVDDV